MTKYYVESVSTKEVEGPFTKQEIQKRYGVRKVVNGFMWLTNDSKVLKIICFTGFNEINLLFG
jgi:hypothetical protein